MVSVLFYINKIAGGASWFQDAEVRRLVLEGAPWWQPGLGTGQRLPPHAGF